MDATFFSRQTTGKASTTCKAEKYLTFGLGHEQYGVEILQVREIIGLMDITAVPRTPTFMRGVINLRGKVIPVIDLRIKFGMDHVQSTEQTCIIVLDIIERNAPMQMGIIVDSVSEVLDIEIDDIQETPTFGTIANTDFIKGIAKTKGGIKILLNIERVLCTDEIILISQSATSESIG